MKGKKIALLTPTFFYYSGIDRVVEQQAIEYAKNNEVTVIALDGDIKPKNYRIVYIGMPKSPLLQRLYKLLFFLDRAKIKITADKIKDCDIIISHFYPMNWIARYSKKRYSTKYTYYNHGIGFPELFTNLSERIYMRVFRLLNFISINNADSAISISKFLQSELKEETGLQSKVVYNKIDKKFRPGIDAKIKNELKIKNEKLLLFVGRLSPHKNIHGLIEAFNIIKKKIPSKLIIIGKPTFPQYYSKLKKISDSNVIFKEYVDDNDLPRYYSACDLYVTASLWEGFDLPAAEAQACGKKVIAYAIGSHPEIVKKGKLVRKIDSREFANAVISLLK